MRINTGNGYEWRTDLYDQAGELLNENTRSGAVDASAQFATEMIPALQEAANHPDMTKELAEVLSTSMVEVEYEIRSGVNIND